MSRWGKQRENNRLKTLWEKEYNKLCKVSIRK